MSATCRLTRARSISALDAISPATYAITEKPHRRVRCCTRATLLARSRVCPPSHQWAAIPQLKVCKRLPAASFRRPERRRRRRCICTRCCHSGGVTIPPLVAQEISAERRDRGAGREMKLLHVVGARPNFPKLAPVYRAGHKAGLSQVVVHTGQHYDDALSDGFFRDL